MTVAPFGKPPPFTIESHAPGSFVMSTLTNWSGLTAATANIAETGAPPSDPFTEADPSPPNPLPLEEPLEADPA
jgi:hypothetical protein